MTRPYGQSEDGPAGRIQIAETPHDLAMAHGQQEPQTYPGADLAIAPGHRGFDRLVQDGVRSVGGTMEIGEANRVTIISRIWRPS